MPDIILRIDDLPEFLYPNMQVIELLGNLNEISFNMSILNKFNFTFLNSIILSYFTIVLMIGKKILLYSGSLLIGENFNIIVLLELIKCSKSFSIVVSVFIAS